MVLFPCDQHCTDRETLKRIYLLNLNVLHIPDSSLHILIKAEISRIDIPC